MENPSTSSCAGTLNLSKKLFGFRLIKIVPFEVLTLAEFPLTAITSIRRFPDKILPLLIETKMRTVMTFFKKTLVEPDRYKPITFSHIFLREKYNIFLKYK